MINLRSSIGSSRNGTNSGYACAQTKFLERELGGLHGDGAMNPGIDETPRAVLDRPARGVFAPVKVHPDSQMRQLAATTPLSSIRSRKPSFVGARRPT